MIFKSDSPQQAAPPPAGPAPQPVQLHLPHFPPSVTYSIIGITVLIFALQMGTKILLGADIPAAIGIKDNDLIRAGQLWRLFTPMLLHDNNGLLHIGFNMYFLFIVGRQVEQLYGHERYLTLYVLSGFAGVVLSFLFSPYRAWGASGALFGLLGAQAVIGLQNRALFRDNGQSLIRGALSIAGINIVIGFFIGADNWGHIGGLLGGAMFAWFAGPRLVITGGYPSHLELTDSRGLREALNAAALVLLLFGALTTAGIFLLP